MRFVPTPHTKPNKPPPSQPPAWFPNSIPRIKTSNNSRNDSSSPDAPPHRAVPKVSECPGFCIPERNSCFFLQKSNVFLLYKQKRPLPAFQAIFFYTLHNDLYNIPSSPFPQAAHDEIEPNLRKFSSLRTLSSAPSSQRAAPTSNHSPQPQPAEPNLSAIFSPP